MAAYEHMSDDELLFAWKAGTKPAGAALLRRYHASIARFFMNKLGPDCDDQIQATFLGLIEGIDRYRAQSSFRTYLFAIARNQLISTIHARVRDRKRFDSARTSLVALDISPTGAHALRDQQRLMLTALRHLPLDVQIMLELHYWEQMKIREIAATLDMNPNTVKTRMARGRAQLQEHMEQLAASPAQLQSTLDGLSDWAARLRQDLGDEAQRPQRSDEGDDDA